MQYNLSLQEKKLLQAYHMKSMMMHEDELKNATPELMGKLVKHSDKLGKLGITVIIKNNKFIIEGH